MNKKIKMHENRILIDLIVLNVLAALCMLLPFVSYTYKGIDYTIMGIQFLTGTRIRGGQTIIAPQGILWVFMAVLALAIVLAVVFPRIKGVHAAGLFVVAAGIVQLVTSVGFSMLVPTILSDVKNGKVQYGVWITMAIGLAIIAKGFYILYKNKVLGPLDFMIMPGCIYLLINNYFPLIGISLAFKDIDFGKGLWNSDWVGFSNFKYLFLSSDAWIMTRNTVLYNLAFIILGTIMGVTVGIFLNEIFSKKLQKIFQSTILLPQLISIIIIAYIAYAFLSSETGLINNTFLSDNKVNFYGNKIYWPFILIFVNIWKGLGYNSIIYLSSIVGIDKSLYEAAYVDGAGRWQQIKSITLPLLKPTIITLATMSIGRMFYSDFGLFFQVPMDSGALYSVTQTIDTYVYRSLMQLNNISMASAASAYQSIVGFILVLGANMLVRKIDKDNALF